MKIVASIALVPLFLFLNCSNPLQKILDQFDRTPEIDAFTKAVKVSLPLAYAANTAMDAVNGIVQPGVTVVRTPPNPDSFPCNAIVTISVTPAHPLPVGPTTVNGAMVVAALWSDSNAAVGSVFFTNTNIKDGTFSLKNVALVPMVRDTSGTMVVFASEGINTDSAETFNATVKLTDSAVKVQLGGVPTTLPTDSSLAVNQKAWITIAKLPAGGVLGQETYTLYGASQYLGVSPSTTDVVQAVMLAVTMKPFACRSNPLVSTQTTGYAMILDLKVNTNIEMGTTILGFGNACDGKGIIRLATGCYIMKTGSTVALNLDK
ncbi:MAG TPA: hypothetical protein VLX68_17565 [Chitinivibrionales bacterium]|nr:hypothetical protein [Chitinivibrionales bacterium]